MIRFNSDYTEGACECVMQLLQDTNMEQTTGYGEDGYCAEAAELIRRECKKPDAAVHFLIGGTQTNFTVIAAALRPHQGVLCAESGHINVHETGAVEATGHKVLPLRQADGKINAEQVREAYIAQSTDASFEHIVQPGMVYVSQPTEYGTIYSKAELTALRNVCRECGLLLYIDGARLGYALMSEENDVSLSELAGLCDAFYIGGTKVGALFGEALVINNDALKRDFRYIMKQRGAMLAKGRLLGVQFIGLFRDGEYYRAAKHADVLAMQIRAACERAGYDMLVRSPTNQQFPILPDSELERISKHFVYSYQQRVDETHSAVRFCTSWATRQEDVDALCAMIEGRA